MNTTGIEGAPSRFVVSGVDVDTRADQQGPGFHVSARVVEPGPGDFVSKNMLTAETLGAPGDTSFDVKDGAVVGTRFLAAPSDAELHDATQSLAKRVVVLDEIARLLARTEAMGGASIPDDTADESTAIVLPPEIDDMLSQACTVATAQPVRSESDTANEPIGMLQAGQYYEVLESSGDWTRVVDREGRAVWVETDALVNEEVG